MKNIHFVGIGGIGMSGLARYMKHLGHTVSGSDLQDTLLTQELRLLDIQVNTPHAKENISTPDLVVHTSVAKADNVELLEAKKKHITTLSRKDFLPFITQEKKVYSVCGAHGKSTTTAILSCILPKANSIIGAVCKSFGAKGSNIRFNQDNDLLVFEADESDKSFLNSNPYCAIVTNAEPEHMENYGYDYEHFYDCYREFISSAPYAVLNAEDEFLSTIESANVTKLYPSQDITNISYEVIDSEPYTIFTLKDLGEFRVWGIGEYIAVDASLAILASLHEIDIKQIRTNLLSYQGIKKRFDIVNNNKSIVIDDYGHHPTEIKATLTSIKKYASIRNVQRVTTIWQPHKYSRTIDNLDNFQKCFSGSDELIILPVWSAGENAVEINFQDTFSEYSPLLADKVYVDGDTVFVIKEDNVIKTINNGLIVGFGAGDITYQLRGVS